MPQVPILLKSHGQGLRRLRPVRSVCSCVSLCVYIYSSGDNFYTENRIFNCRMNFLIAFKLQMGKYKNSLIFVQHLNGVLKTTCLCTTHSCSVSLFYMNHSVSLAVINSFSFQLFLFCLWARGE